MCDNLLQNNNQLSHNFNIKTFGKDVLTYVIGQFILLICGFVNFLIIPKLLSVEDYGYWQLFILYSSYVGILHFGFIDGIYIRWAGKHLDDVKYEIPSALKFLLIEQILVIFPLIIILILFNFAIDLIIISVLIYAFFLNLTSFFDLSSQAVKKFKILSAMNVIRSTSFLIMVLIILLVIDLNEYYFVIIMQIISYLIVLSLFILYFRKYIFKSNCLSHKKMFVYGKKNISIGIFVLLGNFSAVLFLTIDRLVVSSNFMIKEFAIYAFALTIAGVIYTFVRAISQVFLPYMAELQDVSRNRLHNYLKPALILMWAGILVFYFPGEKFISIYLPRYTSSLPIMQILIVSVGFGSLIKILQNNYYKVVGKQKSYFFVTLTMLGVAFLLNIFALNFIGTLKSIATATLISFGMWYLINELILKKTINQTWIEIIKSIIFIIVISTLFFSLLHFIQSYLYQILIYLLCYTIIALSFYFHFIKLIFKKILITIKYKTQ